MKPLKRSTINLLLVIVLLIFAFSVLYMVSTKCFERTFYDLFTKITVSQSKASGDIVTVVIDDESIKKIGGWPWVRTYYTDIFEFLENYSHSKLIIFDAIISINGDAQADAQFLKNLKGLDSLIVGIDFNKSDKSFIRPQDLEYLKKNFALEILDNRSEKFQRHSGYSGFNSLLDDYIYHINAAGAATSILDSDGLIRRFEPVINFQGGYYPSLPLSAYLKLNPAQIIIINDNNYEIVDKEGHSLTIPLVQEADSSSQLIHWYKPYNKENWGGHKQYKAWEILESFENIKNGKQPLVNPAEFKDKIVVIGATSPFLHDIKNTPISQNFPGVDIQATAVDNMFNQNFINAPKLSLNLLILGMTLLLVLLITKYFSNTTSAVLILLLAFSYFYIALFAFSKGVMVIIITPYLFALLALIVLYAYKFSMEDTKKQKLRVAMEKYVNTDIVSEIIQHSEEVKLGGKKTELTVLLADIRGFTRISETLEPDRVSDLLNEYFAEMLPIIGKHNGNVNKFIGDAILAVFGESTKDTNHPKNAIICAFEMQERIKELRKKWKKENKPLIGISIGINTGLSFIGNIGTADKMEYTVIGDTVNVACRIEAQNRHFNTQILISETTYNRVKNFVDVIKISEVEIRGREKHINIYEVIDILNKDETR
ncbi:MAG: adenylate/guanylate cyclase domain-containing protein [Candidatus Gastranaerophilales bacterium]|nr:adenylate/guanylate cyclase domain-containing protein [Candidatus Gastranaerophilales bacterium]